MNSEIMRDRERVSLAAWNRRDYDAIVENLSPGVVLVDHIRGRESEGPASYVARFRPILEAHPDMQGETVSMVVEGNTIVHETVWRGRQTEPLETHQGTIPATNGPVALYLSTHMEVDEDGKPTLVRAYGRVWHRSSPRDRRRLRQPPLRCAPHRPGRSVAVTDLSVSEYVGDLVGRNPERLIIDLAKGRFFR